MSDVAIRVEGLGKRFRLRHQSGAPRYRTLREDLLSAPRELWQRLRRRRAEQEEFWALKDVSFEVKRGEVLGIIGRNGAGKSTLLKILSRIMDPTTGEATVYGRIGSLLEVGTGFHPELTGRENIFLSGALLGMKRAEVRRRFDEIVEFAGVEKFLDTPCKHYSSGMYTRLGFAVAAHLDTEILLVDEVLAVGDAEFQAKCITKMNSLAGECGRTVLVVSHNMASIRSLCSTAIHLHSGSIVKMGSVDDCVIDYAQNNSGLGQGLVDCTLLRGLSRKGDGGARIRKISFFNSERCCTNVFAFGEPFRMHAAIEVATDLQSFIVGCSVNTMEGQVVLCTNHYDSLPRSPLAKGAHEFEVDVSPVHLSPGRYSVTWAVTSGNQHQSHDYLPDCATIMIEARVLPSSGLDSHLDNRPGLTRPPLTWRMYGAV